MARPETLERFTRVFREVFGDPALVLTEQTTAADVPGWDSLKHLSLVVAVEAAYGVRFLTRELHGFKNVGEMMACVERKEAARRS